VPVGFIAPCLPTSAPQPPSGAIWLHEIKHDGFRVIARKNDKRVKLYSRPGNDLTYRFPLIVEALAKLRSRSCIIDGEAVACSEDGIACFGHIRYRRHDGRVFLYAFDLIELDMTVDDLMTLREIDSPIDGHPNPALGFPFFDAATGSLGQGLSVAGGLGCAARIDGIDKVVYCIIGDGESREGQIWEAMDFIRDQRLSNVVALFNCNELGQSDFVSREQDWTHLQHKAKAFAYTPFE
jgi:ATP dependent DNA ligase domain/Transketolase, thiamine diphosphate binding domain